MCGTLGLGRSSYYYKEAAKKIDTELENAVVKEFYINRECYGRRKLKQQLSRKQNGHRTFRVSRRKVGGTMRKYSLASKYTLKRRKKHKNGANHGPAPNKAERKFSDRGQWPYIP